MVMKDKKWMTWVIAVGAAFVAVIAISYSTMDLKADSTDGSAPSSKPAAPC